MRAYLPRFVVAEPTANVRQFHTAVESAAGQQCALAIFPEQFITGYRAQADPAWLRGEFTAASARHPQLLLCCGTISEADQNRQYWYYGGREVACYNKVHLFRPNGEDGLWRPGEEYLALDYQDLRIGLGTCNDVRFPEQMAMLSRQGKLHLLVYPALWPASRDHIWAALLRARAIEHGCFCLGCCIAGIDNGLEEFTGAKNYVFDPLGTELHPEDGVYELALARLGEVLVDTAREYVPAVARPPVAVSAVKVESKA